MSCITLFDSYIHKLICLFAVSYAIRFHIFNFHETKVNTIFLSVQTQYSHHQWWQRRRCWELITEFTLFVQTIFPSKIFCIIDFHLLPAHLNLTCSVCGVFLDRQFSDSDHISLWYNTAHFTIFRIISFWLFPSIFFKMQFCNRPHYR